MATNLNISENQERVPLAVGTRGVLRSITPDSGSPYYVGARAYVTQNVDGATVTVIDKEGTTTANIYNGQDGAAGQDGADGADGFSPIATVSKVGDTATISITDLNGTTTATVKDGTQANAFTAEYGTTTYADVKDAYDDDAIIICTADDSGNTKIFQLAYFDDGNSIFYFAEPMGDGWDIASVSENDGWDNGIIPFASTDVATQLRDGLMSALDKQKLDGIASGAEVNVQSDWNQSVNTADDYIKNKPTIPSNVSDLVNDSGFITSPNVVYCTCSTASGTAAKVATIESGSLTSLNEGDQAIVKFTNANGKANPTLKIGNTEAKSIMRYGTTAPSTSAASSWNAGSAILFVYDGTYWQMIGYLNTTYSEISEANITNGSGSSSGLVTGRRAKKAVETFAPVKDVTVDGTSVLSGTTAAIDLSGKSDVGHTHTKSEITDFPALAAVATTGNYSSLTDKPDIHNVPSGGSSGQVLSKASGTDYDLAWVNQSGGGGSVTDVEVDGTSVVTGGVASIDLTGKSDVGHTHTTSAITDFPTLATVATSGDYDDLLDKPTIPTVPTNLSGFNDDISTATPTASTVSKFDSSAHINSADMSAQDVSDFVDGLNAQGANLADYVVEQGTSGNGSYRKWNSGTLEQWGIVTTNATSGNTAVDIVFPVGFVDTNYFLQVTPSRNFGVGQTLAESYYTSGNRVATKTQTTVSWYKSGNSYSTDIRYFVIGKWK